MGEGRQEFFSVIIILQTTTTTTTTTMFSIATKFATHTTKLVFFFYHTTNDNTTKKAKESLCYNIAVLLSQEITPSHGDCSGTPAVMAFSSSSFLTSSSICSSSLFWSSCRADWKNSKPFIPSEHSTVGWECDQNQPKQSSLGIYLRACIPLPLAGVAVLRISLLASRAPSGSYVS